MQIAAELGIQPSMQGVSDVRARNRMLRAAAEGHRARVRRDVDPCRTAGMVNTAQPEAGCDIMAGGRVDGGPDR